MIEVNESGKKVLINKRHIVQIRTRGEKTRIWLNSYAQYMDTYEQDTIDADESYTYIKEMLERDNE